MFSIYKKIDKSLNNLYGVESISDISEIDKPFYCRCQLKMD